MRRFRFSVAALAGLLVWALGATLSVRGQTPAAEIPPKPTAYFTDTAGVVDAGTGAAINAQLEQFERQTSNQFIVYIAPKLPDDEEIAPYATDVAQSWGVGTKQDNGAVLFIFPQNHKVWIATGRGINGALTDATCAEIIRNEIVPRFKANDFSGGVQAGVNAMMAAAQHEYKGNGTTVADRNTPSGGLPVGVILAIIVVFVLLSFFSRFAGFAGPLIFTSGGWGGGGSFSDGGGGGGGGGGFSGGGGGFDGGGAGGSW